MLLVLLTPIHNPEYAKRLQAILPTLFVIELISVNDYLINTGI